MLAGAGDSILAALAPRAVRVYGLRTAANDKLTWQERMTCMKGCIFAQNMIFLTLPLFLKYAFAYALVY